MEGIGMGLLKMVNFDLLASLGGQFRPNILHERRRWARTIGEEDIVGHLPSAMELQSVESSSYIKRAFDLTSSFCALVLLSPIFLLIAVAIRSTSAGPVIFAQDRVGQGGRIFRMYKFRTMIQGADAMKAVLMAQNEVDGPVFKIRNDPRITSVGRFLRRHSLDELPQLVNVLLGDMSVVGPRPAVAKEVVQYRRWQTRRLAVTPGLTCIWQTSGKSLVGFEEWMRMDIRYIERKSIWFDLFLILRTFDVVINGEGSY